MKVNIPSLEVNYVSSPQDEACVLCVTIVTKAFTKFKHYIQQWIFLCKWQEKGIKWHWEIIDESSPKYFDTLKTQFVSHSKHTPSRLYKPVS